MWPQEYNTGDVLWLGDWSLPWIAALLVLGLLVLGLSAYDLRTLRVGRRLTLLGLRAAVYLTAVALLLEPAVDLKNVTKVKNQVAVLVDKSASMRLGSDDANVSRDARVTKALEGIQALAERTQQDHQFTLFEVGEDVKVSSRADLEKRAPEKSASNLSAALQDLKKTFAGQDLGGVILLSDGIDTGALGKRVRRGEQLDETSKAALAAIGAPINTLAAARAQGLRDLAIARVLRDDFAFVHNKVSVDVVIHAVGFEATTIPVTLRRDGQVLQTRQLSITPQESRYKTSFEFVPKRIGKEIYTVSLPEFEGEALLENNEHHFLLKIIRDKVRVLQVVGRPSWDERFLRRLLKRDPNIDLISFFILRTNSNVQDVDADELSLIPFPTQELFDQEIGSFDLVIFQNFNFGPYSMRKYLPRVRDFVKERGGGFVMLGGDLSFANGGYSGTPIEEILPVELPGRGPRSSVVDESDFRPLLTKAGTRHPITQLAFDPQTNRELWATLPPQHGTNIVRSPKPGATVLATHPKLKVGKEPMPVITVSEMGKGRVMAMTTDSTWRWGFEHLGQGGTPREYQLFWNNSIRWLIKDPELKLVKIELAQDTFAPGDEVPVELRISRPDYTPAAGSEGTLTLTRQGLDRKGEVEALEPIAFEANASGRANLTFRATQAGVYKLKVSVKTETGTLTDEDIVLVTPSVAEYRDIVPRDDLLEEIARATGGVAQLLPDIEPRAMKLLEPRTVRINRRKVIQLWDSTWTFLLILALLAFEWSLRRRWGRL